MTLKRWLVTVAGAVIESHDDLSEAKRRADYLSVSRHETIRVFYNRPFASDEAVYSVENVAAKGGA